MSLYSLGISPRHDRTIMDTYQIRLGWTGLVGARDDHGLGQDARWSGYALGSVGKPAEVSRSHAQNVRSMHMGSDGDNASRGEMQLRRVG
jgi:hypothetical protein